MSPVSLTCLPCGPPEPLVPQAGVSVWGRAVSASGLRLQELGAGRQPHSSLAELPLEGLRAWRAWFRLASKSRSAPGCGCARRGSHLCFISSTVGAVQRVLEFEGASGLLQPSSFCRAAATLAGTGLHLPTSQEGPSQPAQAACVSGAAPILRLRFPLRGIARPPFGLRLQSGAPRCNSVSSLPADSPVTWKA